MDDFFLVPLSNVNWDDDEGRQSGVCCCVCNPSIHAGYSRSVMNSYSQGAWGLEKIEEDASNSSLPLGSA